MYKSNPTAFAEWKELCMSKGYLSDIFGTLEDPKEFDEEKLFAEACLLQKDAIKL